MQLRTRAQTFKGFHPSGVASTLAQAHQAGLETNPLADCSQGSRPAGGPVTLLGEQTVGQPIVLRTAQEQRDLDQARRRCVMRDDRWVEKVCAVM